MGITAWLIPQERRFFDLLEEQLAIVREGIAILKEMVSDSEVRGAVHYQKKLKVVEHRGDDKVHEIYRALNQTFITPIDREDIAALTSHMDDILDFVNASVRRMVIYGIDPTKDEVIKQFAENLSQTTDELTRALKCIRHMPSNTFEKRARAIHSLENKADDIHLDALGDLFSCSLDPVTIMKKKEIYDMLEVATDKCEDVANVLSDIMVKHA
ncbi:MAG: DUF47 family protein [Thermoplasmata archaeon]